MSSVYSAYDAYIYAKRFISDQDLDRFLPRILDDVHRMFWMFAPWRWTLGLFPSFTLSAFKQDYVLTLPTDFLFLQDARIVDGKNTTHLHCGAMFPPNLVAGQMSQIAVQTVNSAQTVRITPPPGQFPAGAANQTVQALYKKSAPQITRATAQTAGFMGFPDEYFWVYQEGVLWRAMAWAQDPRAGSVTVAGDNVQYTGQLAAFQAAMSQVADTEKLNKVDTQEEQR